MASTKLRRKSDKFLCSERTRTMKLADLKNHTKLKDLSQDDLIELLSLMEAELQAKDVLLKAILSNEPGMALPLSHLLNDCAFAKVEEEKAGDILDEEEVWLGEPSAHLNHVVAYHQVVSEQMQAIVGTLQKQHKQVVDQLDEERHKHAVDTAQGDDVTYMLEKQRELLKHQVEVEQAKYVTLEKERDELLKVIEKERSEQYNTFNNLINDCKAFALQLVQQAAKYQKEIDKEKQKNKLISELMVQETQKFKDRIKQLEDERSEFHLIEQKKGDVELKLNTLERKYKETFRQLDEERLKNRRLTSQLKQINKHIPANFDKLDDEEDILYVQNEVEIPVIQAGLLSIQLSNQDDRDSPELNNILPTTPNYPAVKVANVHKSSNLKQNSIPHSPNPNHIASSNVSSHSQNGGYDYLKRRSHEDKKYAFDYSFDESNKRNSYDNMTHASYDASQVAQIRPTNSRLHNSYEEVRNIGAPLVEPKRNSYEGDTRKTSPPTPPPRRGSTLTYADKPPIVKIPQQLQPRRAPSSSVSHIQSRPGCSTDDIPLMILIVCDYGWEYQKDYGVAETNRLVDFVSVIHVRSSTTWKQLTIQINRFFEKECPAFLVEEEEECNTLESIALYEYGEIKWTASKFPDISFSEVLLKQIQPITIRLKGASDGCLHDLAYTAMTPISTLEECIRIAYQEKRLMLTGDEEMEGKYFVACLSHWIKRNEMSADISCSIIKFEEDGMHDLQSLTNTLLAKGILQKSTRTRLDERIILILNIDFMESKGLTSLIFDWLTYDPSRTKIHNLNGYNSHEENCFLNEEVIILAYSTNQKLSTLTQLAYRIFKMIKLPSILPGLVQSWLRQNILEYSPEQARDLCMVETVKWLSNVYHSLYKNTSAIELSQRMPDISVYIRAPLSNSNELYEWVKDLWNENIIKCVEKTVRFRSSAATDVQQEILVKTALTTLIEKCIRPGCPFDLEL